MQKKYYLCTGRVVQYDKLHEHPGAHVIGHIQTLSDGDRNVTALARWTMSTPTSDVPPISPEIDMYLIGDARLIRCRAEGCTRRERWEPGLATFLVLMDRYQQQQAGGQDG
jgi:hypothetical protein